MAGGLSGGGGRCSSFKAASGSSRSTLAWCLWRSQVLLLGPVEAQVAPYSGGGWRWVGGEGQLSSPYFCSISGVE